MQVPAAGGARKGGGDRRVPVYLHDDTYDGAVEVGRSQGLAAAFEKGWATAETQVEVMLLNYDEDLCGE